MLKSTSFGIQKTGHQNQNERLLLPSDRETLRKAVTSKVVEDVEEWAQPQAHGGSVCVVHTAFPENTGLRVRDRTEHTQAHVWSTRARAKVHIHRRHCNGVKKIGAGQRVGRRMFSANTRTLSVRMRHHQCLPLELNFVGAPGGSVG